MNGRRLLRLTAALLVIAVAVPACSIPSRPYWWPHKGTAATTAASAARLAHASSSKHQLGIDIYWYQGTLPAATVKADAVRIINYAVSLHANSISVSFPFYTPGPSSSALYVSKKNSPSAAQVGVFVQLARKAGLSVAIRPLLSELSPKPHGVARSQIRPHNLATWFRSYGNMLKPYLRVAQTDHATSFVIGTELTSLSPAQKDWRSLIAKAGRIYRGRFLFEDRYSYRNKWFGHFNAGFDADMWPGFKSLRNGATVGQITAAWKTFLRAYGRKTSLSSLVISETGIAAVPGAYQHSASWFGVGAPTRQGRNMQRRWYAALCAAAKSVHLSGLYWWEINFTADPAHPALSDRTDQFTFMGEPAQSAVSACFKSW
jgi:hypothetical protein